VSADFLFLGFAQEVFYHFQLPFVQHALVVLVAYILQGLEKASGLADFLAEEVYGTLVAMVGIVEQGQAAELALASSHAPRGINWFMCVLHGYGYFCFFLDIRCCDGKVERVLPRAALSLCIYL
jgi:hypothetical protein